MIQVRDLEVRRAGVVVLQGINIAVARGDIVGVIGPPESGKTTLFKALAGLVASTAGEVRVDGQALLLQRADVQAQWQQRIGFAFQNNALFDALSVFDNVAFPLRRRRIGEADVNVRVRACLDDVGLTAVAAALPSTLSGGMQKRVGIARAAVIEPELGLFDDPIAGLDPLTASRILELLCGLSQRHRAATMIISNDLTVLLPICSRVIMLCAGEVVYDGSAAELVHSARPEVVQFATGSEVGPL